MESGGFHGRSRGKLGDSGGISHDNWGFLVDKFHGKLGDSIEIPMKMGDLMQVMTISWGL